jgi:hypothetical protein
MKADESFRWHWSASGAIQKLTPVRIEIAPIAG